MVYSNSYLLDYGHCQSSSKACRQLTNIDYFWFCVLYWTVHNIFLCLPVVHQFLFLYFLLVAIRRFISPIFWKQCLSLQLAQNYCFAFVFSGFTVFVKFISLCGSQFLVCVSKVLQFQIQRCSQYTFFFFLAPFKSISTWSNNFMFCSTAVLAECHASILQHYCLSTTLSLDFLDINANRSFMSPTSNVWPVDHSQLFLFLFNILSFRWIIIFFVFHFLLLSEVIAISRWSSSRRIFQTVLFSSPPNFSSKLPACTTIDVQVYYLVPSLCVEKRRWRALSARSDRRCSRVVSTLRWPSS